MSLLGNEQLPALYQEMILDHNKNPRNFADLPTANHLAEGYNPLCGDRLTIYLQMDGDVIREIKFLGSGCAISKASASMMTASLKGKSREEAEALFEKFHHLITGKTREENPDLGKLVVFSGVSEFPSRVKCASLAWHTLRSALKSPEGEKVKVSTEENKNVVNG